MAYHASKVQLSYDFTRTIPTDDPKYQEYQEFRKRFGDDGNLLFVAVQTDKLFQANVFVDYIALTEQLKNMPGVDDVLGFPSAINLIRDTATQKLRALPIFSPLLYAGADRQREGRFAGPALLSRAYYITLRRMRG